MIIRNIYRKFHFIIFPIALGLILGLFYKLVFKENMDIIERKITDIEKKQKAIKLYGEKVKLETELQQLTKRFPHSSDLGWLMANVTAITKKEGMEILTIQPRPIVKENFYNKLQIMLEIQGSYSQMGETVADMDNAENYFQIDSLSVKPIYIQGKSKEGRVEAAAGDGNALLSWQVKVTTIVPKL